MTGLKRLFGQGVIDFGCRGADRHRRPAVCACARPGRNAVAPEAPKRLTTLTVYFTSYEWWLVRWRGDEITCRFIVDHEGLPIGDEIITWCGDILRRVEEHPTLQLARRGRCGDLSGVLSAVLRKQAGPETGRGRTATAQRGSIRERLFTVEPPGNRCEGTPNLQLTGEEPLPNEVIISIQGIYQGEPFTCSGNPCDLPLASRPARRALTSNSGGIPALATRRSITPRRCGCCPGAISCLRKALPPIHGFTMWM